MSLPSGQRSRGAHGLESLGPDLLSAVQVAQQETQLTQAHPNLDGVVPLGFGQRLQQRLLRLRVDLGRRLGPVQIVSALAAIYGATSLVGTRVVVVANVMAWLIQYLSAKLGVVTGENSIFPAGSSATFGQLRTWEAHVIL